MKEIVYHGSPRGDIEVLKSHKSTHQKDCIYATDNKAVALLYMGRGRGDLDTSLRSIDKKPEVVERRAGVFDYLWSLEVISFEKEIKPLKKIYYSNILAALEEEEKKGNLTIYRYPNRPKDMPIDNSDLIEKFIKFEIQGLKGSIDRLLEVYPEFEESVESLKNNKKCR